MKCAFIKSFPVFLLFILFPCLAGVQAQDRPDEHLPIDPQVKTGKLPNGLTYYIRHNVKPEKKVELRLVINAGSILEDEDQQGLAHFTEHMAFNGSANFEKNDIVSFLQSIGVEFGADLNAYTGFDETVYILPIPTEKKENVEKGFQILEDWASTVAFDPAEIEKERGVVLEEERSGRGAEERMFRQTYPKMLEGSKYAERLPIGKVEVLKTFKPEAIRRFYKDWYRPDLMAVIVVGDIDPGVAEGLIKKHFSHLKNPANPRSREKVIRKLRTTSWISTTLISPRKNKTRLPDTANCSCEICSHPCSASACRN
jgi:zinc protease